MQRTGSIMPAFVFILLLGLSAYAAEKTLGSYKSLFERETSKIEAADRTSRKTALSTYGKNLAEAKEALQNRGDLDGTIAANDEIKRFEKERTGPPPALEGYPPLLVRIQKEYHGASLEAEQLKSKNTVYLIKRYLVPLEGLKKQLVRQGEFGEAQKVSGEMKRVEFILAELESRMPMPEVKPEANRVDSVAVSDGRAVWISKDATYTASSVYSGLSPLPSLLTCEGRLYIYRETNLYAFHTQIQANPSITIDLGKTKTIERIYIKNRKGYGMRSKGITAWVSSDSTIRGEQVGTSDELLDEYTMTLSRPRRARFITIGLQRRDYFHLQHVKIFGQDR